jgi:hypothetical protein
MEKIIKEKINSCITNIELLEQEKEKLEKQLAAAEKNKGIDKWIGNVFESSSGLTDEFAEFYNDMKKYLKKETAGKYKMELNRGHFYFFGFFKNLKTEKWAYINCSDVRFFKNEWHNNLLIRTAIDNKDYNGGQNEFSTLTNLLNKLEKLTK